MKWLLSIWRTFVPECWMCGDSGIVHMHAPAIEEDVSCLCGRKEPRSR